MIEKTMMLISSSWGQPAVPTFKLMPVSLECPYLEAIFDPASKILAVIGKEKVQQYKMLYKVNANGDPEMVSGRPRPNGKTYKEERRLVETFQEYYIEAPEEIYMFVDGIAINIGMWLGRVEDFLKKQPLVPPPGEITIPPGTMEAVKDEVK